MKIFSIEERTAMPKNGMPESRAASTPGGIGLLPAQEFGLPQPRAPRASLHEGLRLYFMDFLITPTSESNFLMNWEVLPTISSIRLLNTDMAELMLMSETVKNLANLFSNNCDQCKSHSEPFLNHFYHHHHHDFLKQYHQHMTTTDSSNKFYHWHVARRLAYLCRLRRMSFKSIVTRVTRTTPAGPPSRAWTYGDIRTVVETCTAKAIALMHLGKESHSRFQPGSGSHVHLMDGVSEVLTAMSHAQISSCHVHWRVLTNEVLCDSFSKGSSGSSGSGKKKRKKKKGAKSEWRALLETLAEAVFFRSDRLAASLADSSSSSSSRDGDGGEKEEGCGDGSVEEGLKYSEGCHDEEESEGEEKDEPWPRTQLYFLLGSDSQSPTAAQASSSGSGYYNPDPQTMTGQYSYLSAVHFSRHQERDVALLAIIHGQNVRDIVNQGLFGAEEKVPRCPWKRMVKAFGLHFWD